MAYTQVVDYGPTDGATFGASTTAKISFYGVTPVVQPSGAAQAALTLTTATSNGFGFSTSAAFAAFTAQLEEIRGSLVDLGLLAGS